MITAFAAVFIMPWHLFNSPQVMHFTLDMLGAFIGPLYGILVVDFFLVKKQQGFSMIFGTSDRRANIGTGTAITPQRSSR